MEDKTYIAVFFDVDLPMTRLFSEHKRITKEKYYNLLDQAITDKTIELTKKDGSKIAYTIVATREFYMVNSIDNSLFLICDIKKVK